MNAVSQCSGCKYYRTMGCAHLRFCDYLSQVGHRRERDGDKCLSYEPKRKKRVPGSPPKTARRKAAKPSGAC